MIEIDSETPGVPSGTQLDQPEETQVETVPENPEELREQKSQTFSPPSTLPKGTSEQD